MGPTVWSLLAVGFLACLMHLTPVRSQSTTKHYDQGNNDLTVLTAMVAQLQDTMDQQRQEHQHSMEQLQIQFRELQQLLNNTVEHQPQKQNEETQEPQPGELTKLREALAKYEQLSVDGAWSSWSVWSTCSKGCGGGNQARTRRCSSPAPKCGGAKCPGCEAESQPCNTQRCPLDVHDCTDIRNKGYNTSGVYEIFLVDLWKHIDVYCDLETYNKGWLVFQRRRDGSVDFNQIWTSYKEGFGNLNGEFWLGNEYLHQITSKGSYTLRCDLTAFNGSTAFTIYTSFAVGSESSNYTLTVGGYSTKSTAGNGIAHNDGRMFSTKDRDNDRWSGAHCGLKHKSGWWYRSCGGSYLNGVYRPNGARWSVGGDGVNWAHWLGVYYSLKATEMKIRRH